MQEWEYKYIDPRTWGELIWKKGPIPKGMMWWPWGKAIGKEAGRRHQEALCDLGAQGWELIAQIPRWKTFLGTGGLGGHWPSMIFKRPMTNNSNV